MKDTSLLARIEQLFEDQDVLVETYRYDFSDDFVEKARRQLAEDGYPSDVLIDPDDLEIQIDSRIPTDDFEVDIVNDGFDEESDRLTVAILKRQDNLRISIYASEELEERLDMQPTEQSFLKTIEHHFNMRTVKQSGLTDNEIVLYTVRNNIDYKQALITQLESDGFPQDVIYDELDTLDFELSVMKLKISDGSIVDQYLENVYNTGVGAERYITEGQLIIDLIRDNNLTFEVNVLSEPSDYV